MELKRKPVIGEKLFLVECVIRGANKGRGCTVSKVGRKYFYVSSGRGWLDDVDRFYINTWAQVGESNYPNYILESAQLWLDSKELSEIRAFLRNKFSHYSDTKLSLAALRTIKRMVEAEV